MNTTTGTREGGQVHIAKISGVIPHFPSCRLEVVTDGKTPWLDLPRYPDMRADLLRYWQAEDGGWRRGEDQW